MQKKGKCGLCNDDKDKPITGKFYLDEKGNVTKNKNEAANLKSFGLCEYHYWAETNRRSQKKNSQTEKGRDKIDFKKDLNIFFADQLPQIPNRCENCKTDITYYRANKNIWRSLVAHILPKRENYGFPTVATHPQNRVFLCPHCHGNYDNLGSDFAVKMECLPIMKERFNTFKHLLTESELARVPDYLKN